MTVLQKYIRNNSKQAVNGNRSHDIRGIAPNGTQVTGSKCRWPRQHGTLVTKQESGRGRPITRHPHKTS